MSEVLLKTARTVARALIEDRDYASVAELLEEEGHLTFQDYDEISHLLDNAIILFPGEL